MKRKTVAKAISIRGIGLHSGSAVRLTVSPGNNGLRFLRDGSRPLSASWDNVQKSQLCTMLRSPDDPSFTVSTVEHLMAALYVMGITDADMTLDGQEVPILDGSAEPFVRAIRGVGTVDLAGDVPEMVITSEVVVRSGDAWAKLVPSDDFEAHITIDFENPLIGRQSAAFRSGDQDCAGVVDARTFCMMEDVERMRASGLALGGSEKNAVIFDDGRVITDGGLRYPDEPARHKLLDALGDLHLANARIRGRFVGHKSGHMMTNELLRAAFAVSQIRRAA